MKYTNVFSLIILMFTTSSYADTAPVEFARKVGFNKCAAQLDIVSKHVINGREHGATSTSSESDADNRLLNSQVVMKSSNSSDVAVLSVTPTSNNKCDATYTIISSYDKPCGVSREVYFKNWKFNSEIKGLVSLLSEDDKLNLVLMPSGSTCIAITTQAIYGL